ncbi:MAG: hypothetical protein HOW97_18965 [Catenulispora sp.]|nr:hypothetical protein [Catenulispora sp.]
MSKNARARHVKRRLIAGVALTTVVSAGSATAAAANTGTPNNGTPTTSPTTPGGPTVPVTPPSADPVQAPTAPPSSSTPSPSPTPKPAPPSHPKAGAGHFDNALIATTALTYVGRWGGQACLDAHQDATGQCREFVNCVVYLATGGKIWPVDGGGDYQASFAAAGGVPVAAADAAEGDIIQIGDSDSSNPLHTAIVVENKGNGTFTVVDSNWVGWPTTPELVGVHDWTPPDGARIWRLGAVTAQPAGAHGTKGSKNPALAGAKGSGGGAGSATQDPATAALLTPPAAPNLSTDTVAGLASGLIAVRAADADPQHPATRVRFWIDGKPADAADSVAGLAQWQLDTGSLADGPHQISAQAITAAGAISVLAAPATVTVTNHQLALAVAGPNTPLLTGTVPFAVGAAPATDLDKLTLSVDGKAAPSQPAATHGTVNLDTSTLTAGLHAVSIAVTDHEGRTATWGPVTISVTGAATGPRAVLPSAAAGHGDLVSVTAGGQLVRYPWRADAAFGTPQPLADGFDTVTTLLAGHFAGDGTAAQLLAVRKDGSAHVYGFDPAGKLVDQATITGPAWGTYTRLVAGRFTKDGGQSLVGIDKDGHAQLITLDAAGKTATAQGLSVDPDLGAAPTVLTEPASAVAGQAAGAADRLLAVSATGATTAFTFDAKQGFVKVKEAKNAPRLQLPAPAAAPVLGAFVGTGPEVLVTGADGQTWAISATQLNRPSQGAVFNVPEVVPVLTASAPVVQGQRRMSVMPG